MLKAHSLFYSLVISIIIALVTGSVLLAAYLNRIQLGDYFLKEDLQRNAESGVRILLAMQEPLSDGQAIDLFGEGEDSVYLQTRPWGLFEVGICRAFKGKRSEQRIFQYGYAPDSATALYLTDQNRPLSLCGKTLLKGVCYLPGTGVKRAYIEGQSFTGENLVTGEIRQSRKTLPELNRSLLEQIQRLFDEPGEREYASLDWDEGAVPNSLFRSFADSTLLIRSGGELLLTKEKYRGNILIASSRAVHITSSAKLEDVIVSAPVIDIEEGFRGNLQLFARDCVVIASNCTLLYPSAIGLLRAIPVDMGESFIRIGEGSLMEGVIFVKPEEESRQWQCGVSIENDALIRGQVYSQGWAEIKGTIQGSLLCNKLYLRTPSAVYENHLLNATVDYTRLSKYFVSTSLLPAEKDKRIVKWLY